MKREQRAGQELRFSLDLRQAVDYVAVGTRLNRVCTGPCWLLAAGCWGADALKRSGSSGNEGTETKRERRHLAGSGEVPRLRSAVGSSRGNRQVALGGPGAKRQAAAARLAVAAFLHSSIPPAESFSSLCCTAPACQLVHGADSLPVRMSPPRRTRLPDSILKAGEMDSKPRLPNH